MKHAAKFHAFIEHMVNLHNERSPETAFHFHGDELQSLFVENPTGGIAGLTINHIMKDVLWVAQELRDGSPDPGAVILIKDDIWLAIGCSQLFGGYRQYAWTDRDFSITRWRKAMFNDWQDSLNTWWLDALREQGFTRLKPSTIVSNCLPLISTEPEAFLTFEDELQAI